MTTGVIISLIMLVCGFIYLALFYEILLKEMIDYCGHIFSHRFISFMVIFVSIIGGMFFLIGDLLDWIKIAYLNIKVNRIIRRIKKKNKL